MEIIILNSDNCKEYTTEELEALMGLSWENGNEETGNFWELVKDENYDFDLIFGETGEEGRTAAAEAANAAAEAAAKAARIAELTEELEKLETERQKWIDKNYKKSKGSIFVGDELSGNTYSFNYINNKRRQNRINNYTEYINEIKAEIKKLS